jgi:hypothetical protein
MCPFIEAVVCIFRNKMIFFKQRIVSTEQGPLLNYRSSLGFHTKSTIILTRNESNECEL